MTVNICDFMIDGKRCDARSNSRVIVFGNSRLSVDMCEPHIKLLLTQVDQTAVRKD